MGEILNSLPADMRKAIIAEVKQKSVLSKFPERVRQSIIDEVNQDIASGDLDETADSALTKQPGEEQINEVLSKIMPQWK